MNPDGSLNCPLPHNPPCDRPHNDPCTKKHCSRWHEVDVSDAFGWVLGGLLLVAGVGLLVVVFVALWTHVMFKSPELVKQQQQQLQTHIQECAKFNEYWFEADGVCKKP